MEPQNYKPKGKQQDNRDWLAQRRANAKFIYESSQYNKMIKPLEAQFFLIDSVQNEYIPTTIDRISYQPQTIERKGITNQHALIILKGLSQGNNVVQICEKSPDLKQYSANKLKNSPKEILKKLCRIWIQLLPKKQYALYTPLEFYEKYFRTNNMLSFYGQHNLDLIPTFQMLFKIKDWTITNNRYLNQGFGLDYLPPDILEILEKLPETYQDIIFIYDNFGSNIVHKSRRQRQKRMQQNKTELTFSQEATRTGMESAHEESFSIHSKKFFQSEQ